MNHTNITKSNPPIYHKDLFAARRMSDAIITALPRNVKEITVLCIGTDRSTGDSLGPLTGTLFAKMKPKLLNVRGTLLHPVHALNLKESIEKLNQQQRNSFVIAIDASLGKHHSVGYFHIGQGSLLPGAALKKDLPAVGDAFITGVVNLSGMMEYSVLQCTRLSLVYDMAHTLSKTLFQIDQWLQEYHLNRVKQRLPMFKINSQHIISPSPSLEKAKDL